jgi:hypothetical protein
MGVCSGWPVKVCHTCALKAVANLFARVKVVLPMGLTSKERELFEQLAHSRGVEVHS